MKLETTKLELSEAANPKLPHLLWWTPLVNTRRRTPPCSPGRSGTDCWPRACVTRTACPACPASTGSWGTRRRRRPSTVATAAPVRPPVTWSPVVYTTAIWDTPQPTQLMASWESIKLMPMTIWWRGNGMMKVRSKLINRVQQLYNHQHTRHRAHVGVN